MKNKFIRFFFLLGMELIFASLLLIMYYLPMDEPAPLFSYFLLSLLGVMLFVFLLERFEEKGKGLFFVIPLPLLFIGSYLLSFPFIFTIVICLLVFARTIVHYKDTDKQIEGNWILATFSLGAIVLFYAITAKYPYTNTVVYLIIFQMFFVLTGRFWTKWNPLVSEEKEKKSFLITFSTVIGVLLTAGVLLSLTLPIIRWIFFSIFKFIAYLFGVALSPLFDWAENQKSKEKSVETTPEQELTKKHFEQTDVMVEQVNNLDFMITALSILFFLAILYGFYYFIKMKREKELEELMEVEAGFLMSTSEIPKSQLNLFSEKVKSPSNAIRKEIFEFEKYAYKLQLGRKPYETLQDWMIRLGINDYHFINGTYEKVRYGSGIESDSEVEQFKLEIKEIKSKLKAIQEKLIEAGEITIEKKKKWKGLTKHQKMTALKGKVINPNQHH